MEFKDKLLSLRKEKGLTQEQLAELLFVSRTAISKWESGRGYPSLASLQEIAKYFSITIDELINQEEIIKAAEIEKQQNSDKFVNIVANLEDLLLISLLFLPIFRNGNNSTINASLFHLSDVELWIKISFISIISLSILNGLCGFIISFFDKPVWNKHRLYTGLALSSIGVIFFIATRQPYVGAIYFVLLLIKGVLLFLKRK